MTDWLPGYEHQPIPVGLNWTPGTAWKVGLHSTETGPAPRLIDVWRANPGSGCPHFLGITPDRIVQLLPLSVGAYTAQNPPGGVDTNRSHLIQIEVCAYAKDAPTWCGAGAPWTKALGRWLADLVAAGIPLDLTTELTFGGQWVGFDGDYDAFGGVMGHQHIPEQPDRHWDPGRIDIAALLAEARHNLNQGDDDMPLTDADAIKVADALERRLIESDKVASAIGQKAHYFVSGRAKAEGVGAKYLGLDDVLAARGSGTVDVVRLAAELRSSLGDAIADELADRLKG